MSPSEASRDDFATKLFHATTLVFFSGFPAWQQRGDALYYANYFADKTFNPFVPYPILAMYFILLTLVILLFWLLSFELVNNFIYSIEAYTITPRLNRFIYLFVTIMLLVISRAILLNNQSKLDAIEKERLKQQSLQNELAALKNQVNPHFLFNSLNSLSLLVREDQKAAGKFINKLSFLYRYILQSKDQDLVTLNFIVNINIKDDLLQNKIPTLALQLLMENAVKHNEISDDRPLKVEVFDEGDHLVIKNRLQERTGNLESTNIGLSNLNVRFKLHMDKELEVLKEEGHFVVKIPVV